MIHRPLQSRTFNSAEDTDFWASGVMLMTGLAACAAYILVCVLSLANPDAGTSDDLRASVTVGPVQAVALGDAVPGVLPAVIRTVAAAGSSAGCSRNVLSTQR